MKGSPPLRFLAIVLGGWAVLRTAVLAPLWSTPPADAAAAPRPERSARVAAGPLREAQPTPFSVRGRAALAVAIQGPIRPAPRRLYPSPAPPFPAAPTESRDEPAPAIGVAPVPPLAPPSLAAMPEPIPAHAPAKRWSLSAWSFIRRGDSAPLAAGGLLGGSQAGARLAYRLNRDPARPLALSVRLSTPLRRPAGAEAALGLDWKPIERLPIHLLAERRQALGREGRSAVGLTLYGGVYDAPVGRFRLDAYAQAGVVGARKRDLFGDGSVRFSLPIGRARLGAGVWGAAQPGVERADVGPQASLRLPLAGRNVTLAADWRLRVAGDARPGSGPTLTLATDF